MADSKVNVIKSKSGLNLPDMKLSPKIVIILTLTLAVVAVITATLLYNRRDEPIAPNAPIPAPASGEFCGGITGTACPTGLICQYAGGSTTAPFPDASGTCVANTTPPPDLSCSASFTITATPTPTPSVTPTPTPTSTPTPTPTSTPTPSATPNSCNGTCGSNANCSGSMICDVTSGRCRNPSCLTDNDCGCDIINTPTPTPVSTPQPTPPTLTEAGSTFGTWTLSIAGAILATIGAIAILAF